MTAPQTCRNYINGEWLQAKSAATLESRNLADNHQIVATFPRSSAVDVDKAVEAAKIAYKAWRLVPAPARAELVFRLGELLGDRNSQRYALRFIFLNLYSRCQPRFARGARY